MTVHSNLPEVLAGLYGGFREMLVAEPTKTVGRLEAIRREDKYFLTGNREAPAEHRSLTEVLGWLKYEVILHLMQARPDLLWMHAGAVAHRGRAVLFSGSGGRGKSTLVTRLCSPDWTYLSDDVIPLDPNSGKVLPFPQTPALRGQSEREISENRLHTLSKTDIPLEPETVCQEAVPIGMLVFPAYTLHGPTGIVSCSPATAVVELIQNGLHFGNHRETGVRMLCDLLRALPIFRLSFSRGDLAAELIARTYEDL